MASAACVFVRAARPHSAQLAPHNVEEIGERAQVLFPVGVLNEERFHEHLLQLQEVCPLGGVKEVLPLGLKVLVVTKGCQAARHVECDVAGVLLHMGQDVRHAERQDLKLSALRQQLRIVQRLGVIEQCAHVVHHSELLLLGSTLDIALLGVFAIIQHHRAMLDQQRDVHELQGLDVDEGSPQQKAKGFFERLALLHHRALAELELAHGLLDIGRPERRVVVPPLELVDHP
mmetsp:Transcript_40222/g.113873  ORF Transcript_40222/g.113873 Transcript_40222/m.113873 type:complete len:231 (-) Transcript_40222:394-1086(-)